MSHQSEETNSPDTCFQGNDLTIYSDFEDMPMFNCEQSQIDLLQGIIGYGFTAPSQIQERAIVPMFQGKSVIAQAHSGTGKTGTFVIGSLSRLDLGCNNVQIVVVAPTHELASQTHHVYCSIGQYMIKNPKEEIVLCIGRQVSVERNIQQIKNGAKIIVGTPGRILQLVRQKVGGKQLINPRYCKILILDEADHLLAKGDSETVDEIVSRLDDVDKRSDLLRLGIFSATFNKEETLDEARKLCLPQFERLKTEGKDWTKHPDAPVQILLKPERLTLAGIHQYYFDLNCDADVAFNMKAEFIIALNSEHMIPVCIIYVNKSNTALKLRDFLEEQNLACDCIYGKLESSERMRITDAFRKQQIRILISTDLFARGIDIRQIALVINFELPYVYDMREGSISQQKVADYLHRIGRSGRFGRDGVAINLIATPSDRERQTIIEKHYGVAMEKLPDDVSDIY